MNEPAEKTERFPEKPESVVTGSGSTAKSSVKPNLIERPVRLVPGEKYSDFRVLRLVGQGAFADVYLAFQETLQRLVALKTSVKGSAEPQMLSQLDHRNIIRVFDQRECENSKLVLLYMQFAGGGTLADVIGRVREMPANKRTGARILESVDFHLKANGTWSANPAHADNSLANADWPTSVAWIGRQLAEGLDYAHRKGVLHRDIKPANVLLASDGTPQLADFNVSQTSQPIAGGAVSHFGGSLAYMSPEQLQAADPQHDRRVEELDNRSDLFSLGIVLWELLYGQRPLQSAGIPQSWDEAISMETTARTRPLPLPEATDDSRLQILDRTIRGCLQPNPDDRPASGAALARSLRLVLYPAAARRMVPQRNWWTRRLAGFSAGWLILLAALVPNLAAAVFNTLYNGGQIVSKYPELWPRFVQLTATINLVLFPAGIAIVVRRLFRFHRELESWRESARIGLRTGGSVPNSLWSIGHEIALLCGGMWLLAGILFPILLMMFHREFAWRDAVHFFSSLTICGGIVMTYPFLGITLLNLRVFYPKLARETVYDREFSEWTRRIRKLAKTYLLVAAAVPLIALTLLVLRDNPSRTILLSTILVTGIGFGVSFLATQEIDSFAEDLKPVLNGSKKPGH